MGRLLRYGQTLIVVLVCGAMTISLRTALAQSPGAKPMDGERARTADSSKATDQEGSSQAVRYERESVQPTEGYFAGFGGYTFGGKFDPDGFGTLNGVAFANRSLADSGVYGLKAGGFFPSSLSWFGVEAELFNTTPNVKQEGSAQGSHLRVTTLAINAIARAQFSCTSIVEHTERVTDRFEIRYERQFCRLQPYAGVGLGINWLDMSNSTFSAHANFVPGLNVLGGIRYYFTERIAMFTEYKYNRATFDFVGPSALGGFSGVYSVNHIVGGFSYHY